MKKADTYFALRALSIIYFLIAAIILLGGFIAGFLIMTAPFPAYNFRTGTYGPATGDFGGGMVVILWCLFLSVSMAAFGQLIQVVLEMLENSRAQTQYLRYLVRQSQ